jgi:ribonuclease HI
MLGIKYCMHNVDPSEWTKHFERELDKVSQTLTPFFNNQNHTDDMLDDYVATLSTSIQNAIALSARERIPSSATKPWWDMELTAAARNVANARLAQQSFQNLTGEYSLPLQTTIIRNRNFFKRLCKFKKKTWATATLEKASSNDIWNFPNWSKGIRNYPTPPISRGPNLPKATTHEDKCEALRKELYQPPPPLARNFLPDLSSRFEDDLPFTDVTTEEIRDAIFKNGANTAPGHSQITYRVLKWAWSSPSGQKFITDLIQKCLRNGYHPKAWRKAIAIALRKPNKPDYSNPRAYRLITLLECLAKVLERIVAKRLTYLAGSLNLVPPNQFGGRSNSSTEDPIMTFITDIQAAWNNGKVTSALTFDIKGYFDFVNHDRLLCELRRKHIPLEYVKWTASFLSNREAAICIDGRCSEMLPVENGIPQGSPVSPILASFYSAELIESISPPDPTTLPDLTTFPSQPTHTNIIMYVDDGKLYVSSNSLETNVILLKAAYHQVETWLISVGLAPDLSKREIMHYSRRRKYDCNPPITLEDYDGTTRTIVPDKFVRWLGVHFDRKLLFNHHVKILAARGENAANSLNMLANTIRGLSHLHLRRLYLSCIIPKILYACPTWWNGTKCMAKPFEKVQRHAVKLICAAFKTTPTYALEIEASIPPIKFQADLAIRRYATRLNKLPISSPVLQRLPNEWRDNKPPTAPPPLTTSHFPRRKPATTLQKAAKHTSHDHERSDPFASPPWKRTLSTFKNRFFIKPHKPPSEDITSREMHLNIISNLQNDPNVIYLYSDGSKINKAGFYRIGAAAVAYYLGNEVETGLLGLGGHAEVFDAEMAALSLSASKAANIIADFLNINSIHFFADNAASINAITDPKPGPAQYFALKFHNTLKPLLESNHNLTITVAWCPSHCDIPGNERADELAKQATMLERQIPFSVTRSNAKRRAKRSTLLLWQQEWGKNPRVGRFAIANCIPPSLKPTHHLLHLKGKWETYGRLIQCRTGHAYTGEFRRSFIPLSPDPSSCPCDNELLETRTHILRDCPRYAQHRNILVKASRGLSLTVLLGSKKGITALADFLTKSGAFSRTGNTIVKPLPPLLENEPEPDMERELAQEGDE